MARGGLANAAGAAVSAASGVGVVLAVTNAFPAAAAGVFFTLTSLVLIVAAAARLGTPSGLVYFLSRQRGLGYRGHERRVLALAVRPVLLLSLAVSAALFAGAPQVLLAVGGGGVDGFGDAELRLLAVLLPFTVLLEVLLSATRGLGGMRSTVLIDRFVRAGLQLVLTVGAAVVGSLVLVVAAWALPYVPAVVLAWRRFHLSTRVDGARPEPPTVTRGAFWRFTAPRSVASVVQIALQRLDIIVIAALLGAAPAAIYTAASRFLVVGQLGGQAVSLAAQPRLGGALATGRIDEARVLYRTATAWLVLACWPLYLVCLLFADQMLALFGPQYVAGRNVVMVLGSVMLVATACGMVDMMLIMAGRTSWTMVNSLLALGVNIVVDIVLIPRIGIVGAAIGWAAAIAVKNVLPLGQLALVMRIHPFGRGTVVAMGLSLLGFGIAPLLGRMFTGNDVGTLAGLVVGASLMVVGCLRERRALALDSLRLALHRTPRESR